MMLAVLPLVLLPQVVSAADLAAADAVITAEGLHHDVEDGTSASTPSLPASDPVAVGRRAATSFVAHPNFTQPGCASCCFFCWNYGAGLIFDGLHELSAAGMLEPAQAALYRSKTDAKMDYFLSHNGSVPHDVLSGSMSPLTDYHDCGDSWMWGMNYLNRAISRPSYNSADQRVASLLGTNFSLHCPDRLPDTTSTFARPGGGDAWPTPTPEPNFVWADGSFMAMVLPARLAVQGLGPWASDQFGPPWMTELVEMHVNGYRKYLRDPVDNLYRHGYNYEKKEASCCKWGRANGWLMMSRVEVLLGAKAVNADGEMKMHISDLSDVLAEHGTALCAHADTTTGRLHQLVNETGSFLETSSTAMTHWAITTAVQNGFLTPRSKWDACIQKLWKGVAATVDSTGAVSGVCQGGPIYRNKTDYFERPHAYEASACGGVGSVLRAAAAMHLYDAGPPPPASSGGQN